MNRILVISKRLKIDEVYFQLMQHSFEYTIYCLTSQQFLTNNTVRDRYLTQEIYVEGAGEAMNRFQKQIQDIIPVWVAGERIEFLRRFAGILDVDDNAIVEEGREKFALLDELSDETPD
ncbi:MAG: hypothetical protein ACFFDT_28365, partial [Candidatus Hodarchaeota archaeon]